jgi:hypothetical protein
MAGPSFSPLTDGERNWIANQLEKARMFFDAMSPNDKTNPLTLEALDRAWASWLSLGITDNEQVNATINAVGIQFGQHLVDEAGFAWTVATDSYGTELAVLALPGAGDVLVYPANFVAKRWERKESHFLRSGFDALRQQVEQVAKMHSPRKSKPWWRFWT